MPLGCSVHVPGRLPFILRLEGAVQVFGAREGHDQNVLFWVEATLEGTGDIRETFGGGYRLSDS